MKCQNCGNEMVLAEKNRIMPKHWSCSCGYKDFLEDSIIQPSYKVPGEFETKLTSSGEVGKRRPRRRPFKCYNIQCVVYYEC